MRLGTRLVLGIAAAALLPLLLLGLAANQVATSSVMRRVADVHVGKATNLASTVDNVFLAEVRGFGLAMQAFPVPALSDTARIGFERLVYRQFDDVEIVSLVDENGSDLAPSQFEHKEDGQQVAPGREAVSRARFETFRSRLPFALALAKGISVGEPYMPPDGVSPVVPVAVAGGGDPPYVLGVELSLRSVIEQMDALVEEGMEAALLNSKGEFVVRRGADLVRTNAFRSFLSGTPTADLTYRLEDGTKILAAFSRVTSTGWLAVVAEPYDTVEIAGREIRTRTGYFGLVAGALAAAMGLLFTRSIQKPVVQLRDAAVAVGKGELGRVVAPGEVKELGDLGRAFNEMSSRLKVSHDEIEAQRQEIEGFNLELQERVDERTRELKEAQERLVESGKLAAVAELGAGLAHELNNPLAGILGIAQILKVRREGTADHPFLDSLESQAVRCTEIVRTLLSFTRSSLTRADFGLVDLDEVIEEVAHLTEDAFAQRSISLDHVRSEHPLNIRADRTSFERAVAQVLLSLRAVVSPRGVLRVSGERVGSEIRVTLQVVSRDEQVAIDRGDASRDDWLASGMSLWVARRIVAEHGGHLNEPESGSPGHYVLVLPEA
jgi:two-component system, NtrC family, sensor kinase